MRALLQALHRDEGGQGLVEYALILVLVAVAAVGAVSALGAAVPGGIAKASTALKGGVP